MYLVSVLELMYLYIYKLLICVYLFLTYNMALLHYICIDDVVSLINVRCKVQ